MLPVCRAFLESPMALPSGQTLLLLLCGLALVCAALVALAFY
jgi:hypothetical protein